MLERGQSAVHDQVHAPEQAPSLSSEINTATRNLHTTLNRLITSRLPLALPPYATDSAPYATGLLHFAHIFLTFESLWADILRDHGPQPHAPASLAESSVASPPTSPLLSYLLVNPYDSPDLFTATLAAPTRPSPQLIALLQTLRPRGLIRSTRAKRDLEHLLDLHPTDVEVLLAKYPGDKVAEFCTHIRRTVHDKPWTLLGYAWCFYMAIFSGGRWTRAGLLGAGPAFWQTNEQQHAQSAAVPLPERGLSFWHFPGQFDGEDIKVEFKTRLAAADSLFTADERVDIIEEAKNIFHLCATLVEELDNKFASQTAPDEQQKVEPDAKIAPRESKIQIQLARTQPKPSDPITSFLRRPEVTGTLVALACLACVGLVKLQ